MIKCVLNFFAIVHKNNLWYNDQTIF